MDPDEDLYEKRLLMTFCPLVVFLFLWCIVILFILLKHGQETGEDEVSENHRWDFFGQERHEYIQGIILCFSNSTIFGVMRPFVSNIIYTSRNENNNSENVRSVTVSTQTEQSDVLEPSAHITSNAEMFSPTPSGDPHEPSSDVTDNANIQAIENIFKQEDNQNAISETALITSSFPSSNDVDNQATLPTVNQTSIMLSDGDGKENPNLTSNSVQNDPEVAQPIPSNSEESNLQEKPVDKTNHASRLKTPEDASHPTLTTVNDESRGNQTQNDGETNAMHKAQKEQDLETEIPHLNLSHEAKDTDDTIGGFLAEGNNTGATTDGLKEDFDSSEENGNERSLSPVSSFTSLTDAVLSCEHVHDEDNSKLDQNQDIQLSREILTKIDTASLTKNKECDAIKSDEMTDKPRLLLTEYQAPNLSLPSHNSLASRNKQSVQQYTAETATIKPEDLSSEKHSRDADVSVYEKAFLPTGPDFFQMKSLKEKEFSPNDVTNRGSTEKVDMVDRKHCKEDVNLEVFKLKYKVENNIAEEKVKDQTDGAYAALYNLTSGDSFCFQDKSQGESYRFESDDQPVEITQRDCHSTKQSRKEILKPGGNTNEKDTSASTEGSGNREYTEETNTTKPALDANSHERTELAKKKSNNANELETTSQIPDSQGNMEEHDISTPGHFTNHEPRGLDARNVNHHDDKINEKVKSSKEEDKKDL